MIDGNASTSQKVSGLEHCTCVCCHKFVNSVVKCSDAAFGNYSAVAVEGNELPTYPPYESIPAAETFSFHGALKNLLLFPVHFHRSSALSFLTQRDMVSTQERRLLMTQGHLRHPVLKKPGMTPVLNFIVWRRSALIILMFFAVFLDAFDIYKTVIKAPATERAAEHAKLELQPFHEWSKEEDGAGFPVYIKAAMTLMFNKCGFETAWIMNVRMHVQTGLKLLVVIPLFFANMKWMSWNKSCMWLRNVWLVRFIMPFVTESIPVRLLVDFDRLIKDDVFLLKQEVDIHYDLNHTFANSLQKAVNACGDDPAEKIQGMANTLVWTSSLATEKMVTICGLVNVFNNSPLFIQFPDLQIRIQRSVSKCEVAEEHIKWARKVAKRNQAKAKMHMDAVKDEVKEVCNSLVSLQYSITQDENQMSKQNGQLHNIVNMMVNDGLAALSESLNTLVGVINGIASFKSLWTAALALGPGLMRGTLRAKSIAPEASLPGAFL
eukprot:CAMPEP_0172842454 /NCGR_PEP_ID=MMETSP1075-20121228/30749_1 /TAXON_ID=2916 /ORGANISM="Ceratium fusus, Strain PA161109" /LENGTH=491 /DNA_ID=CAMNT_0013686583 /DNA_START=83 /DNA_END=1554 /DNA_ORIENTATION=+